MNFECVPEIVKGLQTLVFCLCKQYTKMDLFCCLCGNRIKMFGKKKKKAYLHAIGS